MISFRATVFSLSALVAALPLAAQEGAVPPPEQPPAQEPEPTPQDIAPHLQAGRDTIRLFQELTGVLNEVHDRDSADAAVPRVEDIARRLHDIRKHISTLPKPGPGERAAFRKRMGDRTAREAVQGFMAAISKLIEVQAYGSDALLDALMNVGCPRL